MPVIAETAAQARLFVRRGANAAAVVLGASFHPFRTVRDGAGLVRGLVNPPDQPAPAPTDAAPRPVAPTTPVPSEASEPTGGSAVTTPKSTPKSSTTKKTAPNKATAKKATAKPADKPTRGPDLVAPAPSPETAEESAADGVPVEARGPAPHIPPRIAGEIERDYGDEIPGITDGEG